MSTSNSRTKISTSGAIRGLRPVRSASSGSVDSTVSERATRQSGIRVGQESSLRVPRTTLGMRGTAIASRPSSSSSQQSTLRNIVRNRTAARQAMSESRPSSRVSSVLESAPYHGLRPVRSASSGSTSSGMSQPAVSGLRLSDEEREMGFGRPVRAESSGMGRPTVSGIQLTEAEREMGFDRSSSTSKGLRMSNSKYERMPDRKWYTDLVHTPSGGLRVPDRNPARGASSGLRISDSEYERTFGPGWNANLNRTASGGLRLSDYDHTYGPLSVNKHRTIFSQEENVPRKSAPAGIPTTKDGRYALGMEPKSPIQSAPAGLTSLSYRGLKPVRSASSGASSVSSANSQVHPSKPRRFNLGKSSVHQRIVDDIVARSRPNGAPAARSSASPSRSSPVRAPPSRLSMSSARSSPVSASAVRPSSFVDPFERQTRTQLNSRSSSAASRTSVKRYNSIASDAE